MPRLPTLYLNRLRIEERIRAAPRREACPAVLTRRVDSPVPRWFAVRKYRRYDAIAAISTAIGAQLIDASGLSCAQIDHIPSAVDPQRFSPNAAQRRSARAALGIGPTSS